VFDLIYEMRVSELGGEGLQDAQNLSKSVNHSVEVLMICETSRWRQPPRINEAFFSGTEGGRIAGERIFPVCSHKM
jgi:hypothetical protein